MVKLTLDTDNAKAALSTLVEFSDRFPEIVQHLVGSRESIAKLFRVDVDRATATGTDEVRAVLKPTDFLVYLMAALRAYDGNGVVTEVARHG
jgi:hypothetical protein